MLKECNARPRVRSSLPRPNLLGEMAFGNTIVILVGLGEIALRITGTDHILRFSNVVN